ncbi:MAG: quinol:electron acceptor oxidoreductase subunit ActD [Planctomycetota bacterium]
MSSKQAAAPVEQGPAGVLGVFHDVDSLLAACRRMRDAGFTRWEAHSPFPVHGLDEAAGIKPTVLPWIVLACGLTGTSCAILMQWWMNAHDYAYIISGKPFFSLPANIPVAFEMTILFSAFAAFFGMLGLNKFPTWSNPLFRVPEFERVTADRFAIVVDAKDPNFKADGGFLKQIGAKEVVVVPADPSSGKFPLWFHGLGAVATLAAMIPVALILRARFVTSEKPQIHVVPDMDFQWKNKAQTSSSVFADQRTMRLPVEGTISVDQPVDANLLDFRNGASTVQVEGVGTFRNDLPMEVTEELLAMGEERYAIYCAPCHGRGGYGDGPIHQRANGLSKDTNWVQPRNLQSEVGLALSTGQIYDAITNGKGTMQPYASQLSVEERWAVVAYIRALQRSQNATTADLPAGVQPEESK